MCTTMCCKYRVKMEQCRIGAFGELKHIQQENRRGMCSGTLGEAIIC